jgi:hypothetical protein
MSREWLPRFLGTGIRYVTVIKMIFRGALEQGLLKESLSASRARAKASARPFPYS